MDSLFFLLALSYALILMLAAGLFWLTAELKAMQKSTHQVTYLNPFGKDAPEFETLTDEQRQKFESARGEGDFLL